MRGGTATADCGGSSASATARSSTPCRTSISRSGSGPSGGYPPEPAPGNLRRPTDDGSSRPPEGADPERTDSKDAFERTTEGRHGDGIRGRGGGALRFLGKATEGPLRRRGEDGPERARHRLPRERR